MCVVELVYEWSWGVSQALNAGAADGGGLDSVLQDGDPHAGDDITTLFLQGGRPAVSPEDLFPPSTVRLAKGPYENFRLRGFKQSTE